MIENAPTTDLTELVETLADIAHQQWSGWMEYLFSKSIYNADGSVTIPAPLVERWQRQRITPYAALPENEKESDRKEAARVLLAQSKIEAAKQ